MTDSKNPLQMLQGLTQKRNQEPRLRAAINNSEGKREAENFLISDFHSHKKNSSLDSAKGVNFEGTSVGLSSEFRANRSPNKIRRPTSKGIQSISGSKPPAGVRVNPRELSSNGVPESFPNEKKGRESDLDGSIRSRMEVAFTQFEKEEYDLALANLAKAEDLMEKALNNQEKVPFSTVFMNFHNIAAVHYKQRNLDSCKTYLNYSFLNSHLKKNLENIKKERQYDFSNLDDQADFIKELSRKNLYKKYRCKMHLQACIIFSELESHMEAYVHAKQAAKLAGSLLADSLILCYHLFLKKIKSNSVDAEGDYVENLLPILEELTRKIKGSKHFSNLENMNPESEKSQIWNSLRSLMVDQKLKKADMNCLYNGLKETHFLYTMNIMAIAQLHPIEPSKFNLDRSIDQALEIDSIIEQILLMTVSLYALSTELRFWDEANKKGKPEEVLCDELINEYRGSSSLKRTSELWIGRSLEFAYTYLPHNAPLAEQIFSIYSKLYSTTKYMIPEEGEVKFSMKYLMPARGIVRSTFFFVPLIKKSNQSLSRLLITLYQVEQEEENGISYVLEKDKELDVAILKTLKQLKLFETKSRYYESLVKNYQNGQKRSFSREGQGHPELLTLHKQSMALNKIYGKNQVIKGVVARKQYTGKSPLLREDQARTMGNSFYAAENSEINTSLKDHNNTYLPAKTIPESPQNLIGRIQNRIESSHIENRTPLRKSEERGVTHGNFDVSRRVVTDEGIYREDRIKLINDQSLNRSALRPSSPGTILLTSNENIKKSRNSKIEPRHQNNFIIHQNGNQKHFILENLTLLKEDLNRAQKKAPPVPEAGREGNPRKWIRHPPDAKIKILHRRATGVGNKENSSISEVLKTEGAASTGNASPQHFTVESSWYPIATEGAQENELRAKKYSIPERGPIRAVASIRSRVKKEFEGGRGHVIHTDLEISDLANSDIKWANNSLEGIEPLKLRSKSIGKKPTNKTAVIIRKGRKIQDPDTKQLIF